MTVWELLRVKKIKKYLHIKTLRIVLCSLLITLCTFPLIPLTLDETLDSLRQLSPMVQGENPEFRWDPFFKDGTFSIGGHFGTFTAARKEGENGFLLLNSRELFTVPLPFINPQKESSLEFPAIFVDTLKEAFVRSIEEEASRFRIAAIVIDPGHGGRDPGAVVTHTISGRRTEIQEKNIVLSVSTELKNLLARTFPDKRILMTRETDVFISRDRRADMANSIPLKNNETIIFISIHANWGGNRNARGYEVWNLPSNHSRNVLDPARHNDSADILAIRNVMMEEVFYTESVLLANSILNGFDQIFGNFIPNRGRKEQRWDVVTHSRMPAVLVELGFISNLDDVLLMTSNDGLRKYTDALYKGIVDFVSVFERSGGFTVVP